MLAAVALFWNLPNDCRKEQFGKPFNSEKGAQAMSFWTLSQIMSRDTIISVVLIFPHNIYKALCSGCQISTCATHVPREIWNVKDGNGAWLRSYFTSELTAVEEACCKERMISSIYQPSNYLLRNTEMNINIQQHPWNLWCLELQFNISKKQ